MELSIRMIESGYLSVYCADALGQHVRGGSTSDLSPFVKDQNLINSFYVYKKYVRTTFGILPWAFFSLRAFRHPRKFWKAKPQKRHLNKRARRDIQKFMDGSYLYRKWLGHS